MITKTDLNRPDWRRLAAFASILLLAAALLVRPARAQEPDPADLDPADLEELVAPIALYPDDVLGIILPAATFPLDIVRAARFLDALEEDPTLEPDADWDDSIVALLNYPEVVRMMDEDLDWTWDLGEAVLTDQTAVLAAAQAFRSRAYAAGNLRTDDKQIVVYDQDAIEIKPVDPKVVYIPIYEPYEVVVYQPTPVYRYYPYSYPVYYYPYPAGYSFGIDYFWGVTSYFSLGWHSHYVHVHHHTDRLHPYYLNSYYFYTPYYPRTDVHVTVHVDNYNNVWQPSPRPRSRPQTVTVEGRASTVRAPGTVSTVETQPNVSPRRRTTTTQEGVAASARRSATTIGGVAQESTARPDTPRAVESPAVTSSQTRSVRTRQATPVQPPTRQPSTRLETSAPRSTTTAPTSPPRTSTITSGQSTRRVVTAPPPRVQTPSPSNPGGVSQPSPRSGPSPAPQSTTRSNPAPTRSPSAPRQRQR